MDSINDEAVVTTNNDAALGKYEAITRGYYRDPFLSHFLPARAKTSFPRKAPEINRGNYARSASVAYLVEQFIGAHRDAQIVSLGAGYDSLFWRLKAHNFLQENDNGDDPADAATLPQIKYVEVDLTTVVAHKEFAIKRHPELASALSNIKFKGEGLHSERYHLISFDLRQVDKSSLKSKLAQDCQLDFSKPTLCIAECVLVYMPYQDSSALIKWLSDEFAHLTILNYEQCNMIDRFGDIMLENLNARQCDLMGVEACNSLETQGERFKNNGLSETVGWTLAEIYLRNISPAEIERIEKLEFLDEQELLNQLLQHYCIVLGSQKPLDWIPSGQYWLPKTL